MDIFHEQNILLCYVNHGIILVIYQLIYIYIYSKHFLNLYEVPTENKINTVLKD